MLAPLDVQIQVQGSAVVRWRTFIRIRRSSTMFAQFQYAPSRLVTSRPSNGPKICWAQSTETCARGFVVLAESSSHHVMICRLHPPMVSRRVHGAKLFTIVPGNANDWTGRKNTRIFANRMPDESLESMMGVVACVTCVVVDKPLRKSKRPVTSCSTYSELPGYCLLCFVPP